MAKKNFITFPPKCFALAVHAAIGAKLRAILLNKIWFYNFCANSLILHDVQNSDIPNYHKHCYKQMNDITVSVIRF